MGVRGALPCLGVVLGLVTFALPGRADDVPASAPPSWAYPLNPSGKPKAPPDDGSLRHVPGSTLALPLGATRNLFAPPDWHADAHPPMPDVVAHGHKPKVFACAACHFPDGQGRPENEALAGLPAAYIVQQVGEIADGRRRGAQPAMIAPGGMIEAAEHATPAEIASAAAYYAGLVYKPWIRVVETETVPRTEVKGISALAPVPDGGTEPIGQRIIEVPEDEARTALRDDASGFVAYVPQGSLARGEALVHRPPGDRQPCRACHGPDLRGSADVPALAGRSPSALFRQLYDIRGGTRAGPTVAAMVPEVDGLTDADLLSIAAFLAAQKP